jgi:hypothetical protein
MAEAIGRLQKVHLRELWPDEARDFTAWLAENLDILEESLGITLSLEERESKVGPFAADIVAADEQGGIVVIENQLEKTDHDHLGKLLTYLVNVGAKKAVWITPDPRPEHIKVMEWLNEVTPPDMAFYLIKVEAYRIGDSPPAPLFSIVAGPSEEGKAAGRVREEMAERHKLRWEFWQELLDKIRAQNISLHANLSPTTDNWLSTGAGKSGLYYTYKITKNWTAVEFNIDRGPGREEETERIFQELYDKREEIEEKFGGPLEWDRVEGRRARAIRCKLEGGGLADQEKWPEIQEAMIEAMQRLYRAVHRHLR